MRIARTGSVSLSRMGVLLWLCLSLCAAGAFADGKMPTMPEPPATPVYWQLTDISEEPTITPGRGYTISYHGLGLPDDLADGLMAESIQQSEVEQSGVTLTITKDNEAMAHQYTWTPLPIYLEPGILYPITVSGAESKALTPLNSLMSINAQGEALSRISAGGYTGHKNSVSFDIVTSSGLYRDGSLVISLVLRDAHDMFRLRIAYTYTMFDGIKPIPTPIPGFVAVEVPAGVVPSYYDAVEGEDGLWRVTTAPDEYRAYGSMSGSEPMFFPADAEGNVAMDAPRVDPAADFASYVQGFVPETPSEVPPQYTISDGQHYGFITRDGQTVMRAFGRMNGGPSAFYSMDETGAVAEDAVPVDPAADFEAQVKGFGSAIPPEVPAHYSQVGDDLYAFTGRDGQTHYRVFGRLDGMEPMFYPADETGVLAEGAGPVVPEDDFTSYIKGFDIVNAAEPPPYYRIVSDGFFALDDREGNPVYRVYGVLDGMAPAYYPADAAGNRIEDAAAVLPEDDFEAYVKGFIPEEMPDAPLYYYETDVPGVWSFIDLNGETQYRAFGSLNRTEPAFYPSDAMGAVDPGALPINPASDLANMPPPAFVAGHPDSVPAWYRPVEGMDGLYTLLDRDGEPVYRVYGAYGRGEPHFYPADAMGNVLDNADAVDPATDFDAYVQGFVPMIPQTVPSIYEAVEGSEGIYRFKDRMDQMVYRIYGAVDRGEPGFYPSDEWGNLLSETPIVPDDDVVLLPTPYAAAIIHPNPTVGVSSTPVSRMMPEGFKPSIPADVPTFYEPVAGTEGIYSFTDHQGQTLYRIYGAMDRGEPGFFPSDEWGNLLSDTPVAPEADLSLLPTPYVAAVNQPTQTAGVSATPISRTMQEAFTPMIPVAFPSFYEPVPNAEGIYSFKDNQGQTVYRIYGSMNQGEPGFFPSDEWGDLLSDVPVTPEADIALVPTPYGVSVVDPSASANPEETPVARITNAWDKGTDPEPTNYVAVVDPAVTGGPATTNSVVRSFSPAPEMTAEALPTAYFSTVRPSPTDEKGGVVEVISQVANGANQPVDAQPTDVQSVTTAPSPTQVQATATEIITQSPSAVSTPAETPIATAEATEALPTEIATASAEPTKAPEETSQGGGTPWWIAIVVVGVAALGGGAYAIVGKKKKG